jgi:caffeoyl-CoA O-methyltransferase
MVMEIVNPAIEGYLYDCFPTEDPILDEMETRAFEQRFPIVGPLVGRTLTVFAQMIRARRIFEFGSGFGYSTYWFARATGPSGHIVHVDKSETLSNDARGYLRRGGLHDRVIFDVGDALEVFPRHEGLWDIVFLDLDKERYADALALAWPRVRPGGLLIADNVLWSGKIITGEASPATQGIKRFTDDLLALEDGATTILPLRDGLSVTWKHKEV